MNTNYFQHYAFISLGANLHSVIGTPEETVLHAITLLAEFSVEPLLVSSLLVSEPVDCPPGSPDYINAVVGFIPEPDETALQLLLRLQKIETDIGRKRSGLRNEARVLDLDLITFKEECNSSTELSLPHPRAAQRNFVLKPLRQLTGDIVFPGQDKFIDELILINSK